MAIYNYDSEKILRSIPKIMHHFIDGDTAIIANEHKVFTYKNGDWVAPTAGVTVSLMELNQQIVSQMPEIKNFKDFKSDIEHFFAHKNYQVYLLVEHDYHYVTVFTPKEGEPTFSDSVMEIIKGLGALKTYNVFLDYIEIWVTMPEETRMFILMPYDGGCVYYE